MKNQLQIFASFVALLVSSFVHAQTFTQTCAFNTVAIAATNPLGLTGPTYSLNPGNVFSQLPTFVVTPSASTTYTLYTTGLNSSSQLVTSSNTVVVGTISPTFSIVSPQNFTLGCGNSSVATVNIINASGTSTNGAPNGAPVSYSLLAPGSGSISISGTLTSNSTYTIATPGTYTMAVRDNVNFCIRYTPFTISANANLPTAGSFSMSATPLNCSNTSVTLEVNPSVNNTYNWLPMAVAGNSVTVSSIPTVGSSSIAASVTLEVTDINNTCKLDTVIVVYQNYYKPNAIINDGGASVGACSPTVFLTNQSTTGIPPGSFSTNQAVVAQLWMGPSPQSNATLSTTYLAQTTGVYTMVVEDLNNGCTDTATIVVNVKPAAAFTHTVSGANVFFNSTTSGVGAGTTYLWNFGDGVTSNLPNPFHTYSTAGSHVVKLKVKNNTNQCSDSTTTSIAISGIPCVANSGFALVPTTTTQVWNAIPVYPYNIIAAQWSWGDATTSNVLYTSHQYAAPGMYNICLSVTVACVGTSSSCASYSIFRTSEALQIAQVNVVAPELSNSVAELSSLSAERWNLSPNPTKGVFVLQSNFLRDADMDLVVYDFTGKIVYSKSIEKNEITVPLDLSELPNGIYHVSCVSGGQSEVKRLIISH